MMVLRPGPLGFYALSAIQIALISTNAAPLRRSGADNPSINRRTAPSIRQFSQRQSDEINDLIGNITGQTVSNSDALAQSLEALFGTSSTSDTPSATSSDHLAQNTNDASLVPTSSAQDTPSPTLTDTLPTPSEISPDPDPVVSQFTSTATFPVPSGGGGSGSEADDVFSILSELTGAIPTSFPSPPTNGGGGSGSSTPSDGFGDGAGHKGHHDHGHSGTDLQPMDDCSETYRAVSGDTCAAIAGVFDLSAADFLRMNPTVGASCMNLQVGQEYCVQKGAEEEGENGDDDGDEDEDDGDEYGQYVYPTIVHVHNYPGIVPCMACHDQSSDSGQPGTNYTPPGVVPGPSQNGPVTPSAPSSPSNLTVPPTLPTDSPGLNSTNSPPISSIPTNSTDFNSTDSTPLPTLPNSNSTDFNATTTDPDTDSSDSNPDSASSLGDMPLNGTTVVSSMSQPAPSTTSPDTEDSDDILPASNSSDNSGMDSRASGSPRKVSVTWEEDF